MHWWNIKWKPVKADNLKGESQYMNLQDAWLQEKIFLDIENKLMGRVREEQNKSAGVGGTNYWVLNRFKGCATWEI